MPKIVDREEKMAEIVEAARWTFAQSGFRKSTLKDIADKAGLGKATLYYYFENKMEILEAMIRQEQTEYMAHMARALASVMPGRETLKRYVTSRMDYEQSRILTFRPKQDSFRELLPLIWRLRQLLDVVQTQEIIDILVAGVAAGDFMIKDVELTARVVDVTLRGILLEFYKEDDDDALPCAARAYITCLMGEILAPRSDQ